MLQQDSEHIQAVHSYHFEKHSNRRSVLQMGHMMSRGVQMLRACSPGGVCMCYEVINHEKISTLKPERT